MVQPNKKQSNAKLQWHPAFCAAAELELRLNKADLEFKREYNLIKKPLQMDLLIIEKRKNVQIQNEIGRIFRRHNVIEYKSPDDGMTIDDFFKTLGYAYLYKGLGEKVEQIPLEELTISLFRATVPKQLFNKLAGYGYLIEKHVSGIYYNDSAQKTPAVRKNVRGMNAPITNNATIIPTGFSSGIVGFSWPDVLQNAVIRCIALLFQEKHFR